MRHKNSDWSLPEKVASWDQAGVAVLMDIRDELKQLNSIISCPNFIDIPRKLDAIRKNTTKPKRKRAKK